MKKVIYSGARIDKDHIYIDYTYNHPDDIVDVIEPQMYSRIKGNAIYYFGYKFNDNASALDRSKFINAIKQLDDNGLSDDELEQFIARPLAELDEIINLYDIDCLVYPLSNRSPLVSKIIKCINSMTSHEMARCSFEFVKSAPSSLAFDYELFESEKGDQQGYRQMLRYVDEELMPKLHDLDYFSIARDVKPKYRRYIEGFLNLSSDKDIEKLSKLQGPNILVVDDINTTGSTLNEILRKIGQINKSCNIYIFTLIGR